MRTKAANKNATEKLPPHAIEAEQAVLGCCLEDPKNCLPTALAWLKNGATFFDMRHQRLFDGLRRMFDRGEQIDLVTVFEHLRGNKQLQEDVGGVAYVSGLPDLGVAAQLEDYLRIVKNRFLQRRVLQICTGAVKRIYEDGNDAAGAFDELERGILEVNQARVQQGDTEWRSVIIAAIDRMEDYERGGAQMEGLPTGFDYLDKMLCGLKPQEFILIAGRPGTGKTALGFNILENVAVKCKLPVGFFSLEMSGRQLGMRAIFQYARADFQRYRTGYLKNEDVPKLIDAAGKVSAAQILLDERGDSTITEIRAKARRWVMEHGIKMLLVDYVGLVQPAEKKRERREEIGEISRGLKNLAKELNIPVVALAQLNRDSEKEGNKSRVPQLSDLRESGDLEQDAHVVGILHFPKLTPEEQATRDEKRDWAAHSTRVNLHICKQRDGPTGKVELLFQKACMRFTSFKRSKQQEEQEEL